MAETGERKRNRTTLSGHPAASAHGRTVQPGCGLGLCPARHQSPLWLPPDSALCPCTEGRNGEHSLDVHGCQMCVPPHAHSHPLSHTQAPVHTPVLVCTLAHTRAVTPPQPGTLTALPAHTATCAETHLHCHTRAQGHLCHAVSSHTPMCHVLSLSHPSHVPTVTPVPHSCTHGHTAVHTQPLSEPPWHSSLGTAAGRLSPGHGAASTGLRPPQTHHTWIGDGSEMTPSSDTARARRGMPVGWGMPEGRGTGERPCPAAGQGRTGLFVPASAGPP